MHQAQLLQHGFFLTRGLEECIYTSSKGLFKSWYSLFNVLLSSQIKNDKTKLDDMQDKIDLGLEEEGTTEPTNIVVWDEATIKK